MTTAILPAKFDRGDIVAQLRESEACADANNWNDAAKLKKFPAFLSAKQRDTFYALNKESRASYEAYQALQRHSNKPCVLHAANKDVFYAEFEARMLNPALEDPSVYKWEL